MNSSKSRVWWRTVPCGVTQAALAEWDLCGKNWRAQRTSVIPELVWLAAKGANRKHITCHGLSCQAMTAKHTLYKG